MPYTYTPPDSKMAMFHALFAAQHGQQASRYYEHTQHYLSGNLEWDNWQGVGIQGIADVCSRLKSDNNTTVLRRALTHLPSEPFDAFMECLEHTELPDSLANRLAELLNDNIPATDRDVTLIRALAGANQRIQVEAISSWLANTVSEDGLVAIAGRCWNALSEPALLEPYLLTLARNGNQPLFNAIFRDWFKYHHCACTCFLYCMDSVHRHSATPCWHCKALSRRADGRTAGNIAGHPYRRSLLATTTSV